MKILATAFDYRPRLGGIATLAYHMLRALSRIRGVEVRVLAPQQEGDSEFDFDSGVDTKRIPLPKAAYPSVLPLTSYMSAELLFWRPNAILNFLWSPEGVASYLNTPIRSVTRTPYFLYAHGVELMETSISLKKRIRASMSPLKRRVFQGAAQTYTNSSFTRDLAMKECLVSPDKIQVAPPGIDLEEFYEGSKNEALLRELGLEGKKVFFTVSRLESYKGVDRAISALRHVVKKHPNVIYLIGGDGPDRSRLEAIAKHYRVSENVRFLGNIPISRLRDFYNLSDVFLLLSRMDPETPNVEGFGIVFMEAAACGRPSIAGMSGGIPDAVQAGETGWLVDPTDDQAIAQAMIESIEIPEKTRLYGMMAKKRARDFFSWERIALQISEEMRSHVRN